MPESDLELFRQARTGEWGAFETLVSRFEPRVFGLAMRIVQQRQDAEDVTQQTFIKLLENLDQFREEASVASWILRIATNEALTVLRRRRTRSMISLDTSTDSDSTGTTPRPVFIAEWRDEPSRLAQHAEVKRLLEEALAELDDKYRLVFLLRDVEQMSTRETATILGISESNAKVRLLRARLQLRERLTASLGDEANRVIPADHH